MYTSLLLIPKKDLALEMKKKRRDVKVLVGTLLPPATVHRSKLDMAITAISLGSTAVPPDSGEMK